MAMLTVFLIIAWLIGGSIIFLIIRNLVVMPFLLADSIIESAIYIVGILVMLLLLTKIVIAIKKRFKKKKDNVQIMQEEIVKRRNQLMNSKVKIHKIKEEKPQKIKKPKKKRQNTIHKKEEKNFIKNEEKALSQVDLAAQKLKADLKELNEHLTG
ncbi:MAG: hypothetical protein LBM59_04050 [Ruminococcus sp.]|jgi:hypothetical protein|nr:hypothetical protein [Ruminococcus sp.]